MQMQSVAQDITILLVDDDDVDAMSLERSFNKQNLTNPLLRARNGAEGLVLLRTLVEAGKQFIVLLDINMPTMNGFEMLAKVRSEPHFSAALVFMLTTSQSPDDKLTSYEKNVAGYIVKNKLDNGFVNLVAMLRNYLNVVDAPDF